MWIAIIAALLTVSASGILYISFRAANFSFVKRLSGGRRWLGRLICFAFFSALLAVLWLTMNMWNALVCTVHLVLFWLIGDMIALIYRKAASRPKKKYIAGAVSAALCVLYLAVGWFLAHHVFVVSYRFESEKLDGNVRIVQITDSHVGATFHADGFLEHIKEINEYKPDAVVVTGDFVDDDTTREDMIGSCDALGELETKYGVYFIYGNHDKGYYSEAAKGWTNAELRERLLENGVILLEDSSVLVDGRFYIVGRQDRSEEQRGSSRLTAGEIMEDVDRSKFVLMLDHQPYDFDAEAEAGADLVLCGHTHGGQFIPITHVGEWTGENCLRYGHERRENTDFIVSSGISNWTFKFKTGCHSEFVVIDITGK